jgi:hypothetical protein
MGTPARQKPDPLSGKNAQPTPKSNVDRALVERQYPILGSKEPEGSRPAATRTQSKVNKLASEESGKVPCRECLRYDGNPLSQSANHLGIPCDL